MTVIIKNSKKTIIRATRVDPSLLLKQKRIKDVLKVGDNPTITFYYTRPVGCKVFPRTMVTLQDVFLRDYKGKKKSPKKLIYELDEMQEDMGAIGYSI
jgi:hypothetical protein|tara:strand:+ start:2222 stop:2515 length:294 start_codon:yes stop_codon:yes gene_type:complete